MKWNESGFRPPLCTYRLNWARRTSWGWWDDWDDTVLQTQDSKFEPWRSEAEHATSRSRRLPTILTGGRRVNAVIVTTITTPITLALFSVPITKKTSHKNKTKRDGFAIMETDKELYRCELTAHLLPVIFLFSCNSLDCFSFLHFLERSWEWDNVLVLFLCHKLEYSGECYWEWELP